MSIENSLNQNIIHPEKSSEIIEKEIWENLKLYHVTTKEKWEQIQRIGAILSEQELLKRGLINQEQLDDFETTGTGSLDRQAGRDNYVFASHRKQNYGEVALEIDLEALNIPGAKVSTAGDYLMFVDSEEAQKYFYNQEIPASQFISYLTKFLPTLPNTNWFWEGNNQEVSNFLGKAMIDRARNKGDEKFRIFWKLHPEIIFPKELPLKYIKNVTIWR